MIIIHCVFDFCVVRYHPEDVRFQLYHIRLFSFDSAIILAQKIDMSQGFFCIYSAGLLTAESQLFCDNPGTIFY